MGSNSKKSNSSWTKLKHLIMKTDNFGETESLRIKGTNSYRSGFGATLSICIAIIIFSYALQKGITWKNREDYIL